MEYIKLNKMGITRLIPLQASEKLKIAREDGYKLVKNKDGSLSKIDSKELITGTFDASDTALEQHLIEEFNI